MAPPIGILQLSDLHFGPFSRFHGMDPTEVGKLFADAMKSACQELGWNGGLRYCLVTGDIAEAARTSEYRTALSFFKTLLGELGIPEPRCLFVPGNHDVSWTATKKVVLDQFDEGFSDAERDARIAEVKLQHFESFLAAFYGQPRDRLAGVTALGHGAYVYQFPEDRLQIAGLNTCERESHLRQGGVLGREQAQALMNHFRTDEARKLIKIVALHHNPVATVPQAAAEIRDHLRSKLPALKGEELEHLLSDLAGFDGLELLKRIASDCQVQLVLHGHHHASDRTAWPFGGGKTGHTQVLSAGSGGLAAGKLPKDEATVAQLLLIDPGPGRKRAQVVLRVYEPRARADGSVAAGTFAVDAARPRGDLLALSLPAGFAAARGRGGGKKAAPSPRGGERVQEFIAALRDRLSSRYHRWELSGLGAIQPGGAGRPIEVQLDDIYLPLRVDEGYDPERQDRGVVLDQGRLLGATRPLVLRGVAGGGKTTWMRWMFRRLLGEPTALPLMIELRKLAAQWERTQLQGQCRTLEDYLRCWLADSGVSGWQDQLGPLLTAAGGVRPVLLVDGWDELGPLGTELREKLVAFLKAYPRVLAVVSSRPYGESRPAHSDGFEVLDLQPLSDSEIALFSARFHSRVHGLDSVATRAADAAFLRALHGAPDALALARTPLLLTMMLLISRDRPLPDKRHRLYQICIDSLLSARPAHREREGAQLGPEQYRPDDTATRLRAVSALSYKAQASGYQREGTRAPIVRSWDELAALLPDDWSSEKRHGFLAWLVGGAGILTDRADGTLNFAHLSFQEFLCAHYLDATTEGEGRLKLCERYKDNPAWWETLRLWAALVNDREPSRLDPVLRSLIETGETSGFWLVGVMLADGVGTAGWTAWQAALPAHFHAEDARFWPLAESAWKVSRQEDRRSELLASWPALLSRLHWLSRLWAERWLAEHRPPGQTTVELFTLPTDSGPQVARSRTLFAVSPLWPCAPMELVLLRLLPGRRITLAHQLHGVLSLGASRAQVLALARFLLQQHPGTSADPGEAASSDPLTQRFAHELKRDLAHNFLQEAAAVTQRRAHEYAQDLMQDLTQNFMRGFVRDTNLEFSAYFAQDFAHHSAQHLMWYLARDFVHDFERDYEQDFVFDFAREIAWFFAHRAARGFVRDLARHSGLDGQPAWLADWAVLEVSACVGRSMLRTILAHGRATTPLIALFQAASQASLRWKGAVARLRQAQRAYSGEPLWPALARHIARCSTRRDRALLFAAMRDPAQYAPPLSFGLQYYWRGDLLLPDGSELTLDALYEELQVAPPPYLEDYPPHIEMSDVG